MNIYRVHYMDRKGRDAYALIHANDTIEAAWATLECHALRTIFSIQLYKGVK